MSHRAQEDRRTAKLAQADQAFSNKNDHSAE